MNVIKFICVLIILSVSVLSREQISFKQIISQTNRGSYNNINQMIDNQKTYDSLCQSINIDNSFHKPNFNISKLLMTVYSQTEKGFDQRIYEMFNDDSIITIYSYYDTIPIYSLYLPPLPLYPYWDTMPGPIRPAQGYKTEVVEFPIQNVSKYILISSITNRTKILPINRNSISTPIYFKYKCDALGRRYNNSFIKNNRYYSIIKEVK